MDSAEQPIHITGDSSIVEEPEQLEQQSDSGKHGTTTATTTSNRSSRNNNNKSKRNVPKHMRLRYWSSYEELKLVELWRLHCSEMISFQQNHPIFRKIADVMKQYGFQVNPQECRRKINALKNRYINEKQKLDRSSQFGNKSTSEWRLYPLIKCVLDPKKPCPDLQHELRIVNRVLAQLAPSSCVALLQTKPNTNTSIPSQSSPPIPTATSTNPYKRIYNPRPANRSATHKPLVTEQSRKIPTSNESGLNFLLKLKHHFVLPTLNEMRDANQYLEVNRDYAFARLRIEEAEFKLWQTQLSRWQVQQEQVLERLQCEQ